MWLVQNALSACICILFTRTLRLPSLRVAAVFLGLMFLYDIFMVFISPMIFKRSIMVAVATAGASTASVAPSGVCTRTEGDTFPMLFLVPHLAPLVQGTAEAAAAAAAEAEAATLRGLCAAMRLASRSPSPPTRMAGLSTTSRASPRCSTLFLGCLEPSYSGRAYTARRPHSSPARH